MLRLSISLLLLFALAGCGWGRYHKLHHNNHNSGHHQEKENSEKSFRELEKEEHK